MEEPIYFSDEDKNLFPNERIYSETELVELDKQWAEDIFFMELEQAHKEALDTNLPRTISGWLAIFPEATKSARRGVNEKIKAYKAELKVINVEEEDYYDKHIAPAHFTLQAEMKENSDKEFDLKRKEVEKNIRGLMFNLSYINEMEGKGEVKMVNGVTEADVVRAKEVPLEGIYAGHLSKHSKLAVGVCPFHAEKTGSFTIYLSQNSWWCYGCQNGGSVVDFVMQQNGIDFLEAVKQLLK